MAIEKKRIFITGGAGFIGSHIIERLIEDNEIIVYDTLNRNSLKDTNLINHPNLTIIQGDILDLQKLKKVIYGSNIVIHLAAIAGIDTVIKNMVNTMKVNMLGTYNILEAIKEVDNCERFIDFSTSEVFGSYAYKSEEGDPTQMGAVGSARWSYAVSKLAGEHLTYAYHTEFGIPTVSIRPFNIYGPRQVGEGAIHHFVKRAIRNEELIIHGDGDQIRSWCYVDDIIESVILCLEKKEAIGNVFNIGNPRGTITIYGLALAVIRVCDSKSTIKFVPKPYVDVELRMSNIDKATRVLGYKPKVDIEEGIKRTSDWYRRVM